MPKRKSNKLRKFISNKKKGVSRTIKRIIIAISGCKAKQCNFSYEQVHVAFSRVMEGKHIRLLLTGNDTYQKRESLLYLDYLHPDPAVFFYFAGFRNAFHVCQCKHFYINNSIVQYLRQSSKFRASSILITAVARGAGSR